MEDVLVIDNFTKVPNDILDILARTKLSQNETKVLFVILRKTLGWGKLFDSISFGQFSDLTGITTANVARTTKRLEARNIVVVKRVNRITEYAFQKEYTKWDRLDPILKPVSSDSISTDSIGSDRKVLSVATGKVLSAATDTKEKKTTIQKKSIYTEILEHWNTKGIITHKKATDDIKRRINARSKDYTLSELKTAIDNYALVLHDVDCDLMTYRWTLATFFTGDRMERFLDLEIARNNYTRNSLEGRGETKSKPTDYSKIFGDDWGKRK